MDCLSGQNVPEHSQYPSNGTNKVLPFYTVAPAKPLAKSISS